MAFASLREFMARLEGAGRLVRVSAPVSPALEITEIHTRLLAERGPAVLFERVEGSALPLLANLFGTVERVAWGMNREPHQLRELGELLAFLKQPEPPGGWREAIEMVPLLKAALAMKPRTVTRAPCQEVVRRGAEIDLGMLPIQTCWPGEPAPLITWPLVVTKGPGVQRADGFNLGIYRMQVIGRNTAADALAAPPWRRPAPPALAGRAAGPPAGRGGDRCRPRHHPGRGHAGAGHHVRVPVRGPAARPAGRAGRLRLGAAQGAGHRRDRARGPGQPRGLPRRGPVRRSHRLLQRGRAVPGVHDHRHDHAPRPDLSVHLHRPAAGRALGARRGAERRSFSHSSSSSSRRSSTSGCRPRAARTGSPW